MAECNLEKRDDRGLLALRASVRAYFAQTLIAVCRDAGGRCHEPVMYRPGADRSRRYSTNSAKHRLELLHRGVFQDFSGGRVTLPGARGDSDELQVFAKCRDCGSTGGFTIPAAAPIIDATDRTTGSPFSDFERRRALNAGNAGRLDSQHHRIEAYRSTNCQRQECLTRAGERLKHTGQL